MITCLPKLSIQIIPVKPVGLDHLIACPVYSCLSALMATAAECKVVSDR